MDDAIADCEEAAPLSKAGYDSAQTPNFMLRGTEDGLDTLTAEKQAQRHAAAMAQVRVPSCAHAQPSEEKA